MVRKIFCCLIFLTMCISPPVLIPVMSTSSVRAQEVKIESGEKEEDNELDGFGEGDDSSFEDIEYDQDEIKKKADTNIRFGGFVNEEAAYRLHDTDPKIPKLRSVINLDFIWRITDEWQGRYVFNGFYDLAYRLEGRSQFDDQTIKTHERDSEIRDFYVEGPVIDWLRLKTGRQIIAWGESDFIQITDIANPRDQTELGLVDLEDARIPVAATKISVFRGPLELNLAAIHEVRPDLIGARGADFDWFKALRERGIIVNSEQVPDIKTENTEYIARLFGTFNTKDISFVLGRVYDDRAYLDFDKVDFSTGIPQVSLTPKHKKMSLFGVSGNFVTGSFLWKAEAARYMDKAIARDDLSEQILNDPTGESIRTWEEKDTVMVMGGLEYTGITDLRITLEGVIERIGGYKDYLQPDRTTEVIFLLASYQTMNETLSYSFQYAHFSQYKDNMYKFKIGYDIIDAMELNLGVIFYDFNDDESQLYPFRDEDRMFAGIKYSF